MQAVQYDYQPAPGRQPTYVDSLPAVAPSQPVPKNVAFELLLDENCKVRARIPMRVQIYPHDTTDSIVTTVKNFYGIYDGAASGVSFEDELGTTLIARYENLRNNMTVYVRVIPVQAYSEGYGDHYYASILESHKRPNLGEPIQMAPALQPAPVLDHGQTSSRPTSRAARKRSMSPSARGRRSVSQSKPSSRTGTKARASTPGGFHDEASAGYSDSDGGYGSATGTRKSRIEQQFASSDISMENILQDGRRKRPKFESSELPLFVPPQVPLPISPQRPSIGQEPAGSPFARPMPPYNHQQPLPSPQSGYNEHSYGMPSSRPPMYATPMIPEHGHRLRDRTSAQSSRQFNYSSSRASAPGILPTPDPTIASCISDEDVAMQLIRLGDASNFSHGRTSASTMDDAFSGAADAASSTGATSDGEDFSEGEDDLPKVQESPMRPPGALKRNHAHLDENLPSYDGSDVSDESADEEYRRNGPKDPVKAEIDEHDLKESAPKAKKAKTSATSTASTKPRGPKPAASKQSKNPRNPVAPASRKTKGSSSAGNQKAVASPQLVSPAPTRKASISSVNPHPLTADEEDLSTKPRCQRCRKSKKGCDRQRPCSRCKDAGIGPEGCISEDEGNGRKGRYGRHMGVPVKRALDDVSAADETQPAAAPLTISSSTADKSKKRKR